MTKTNGQFGQPLQLIYLCPCCRASLEMPELDKYRTCATCDSIIYNDGSGRVLWQNSQTIAIRHYDKSTRYTHAIKEFLSRPDMETINDARNFFKQILEP